MSSNTPEYSQHEFDDELAHMLKSAKDDGNDFLVVVSKDLHDRVVGVLPKDSNHRMPMACNAMWNLWKKQGADSKAVIHTTPSCKSSTIEIKFKTSI